MWNELRFIIVIFKISAFVIFADSTATKPSCWSTKGVSVTVLTSGELKTTASVDKMPLMESWLQYTALLSIPASMDINYAWGLIWTV